jgi:hypothetical protein
MRPRQRKDFRDTQPRARLIRYRVVLLIIILFLASGLLISFGHIGGDLDFVDNTLGMEATSANEVAPAATVGERPLEKRHPYAGVYPVWGGIREAADFQAYPYIRGTQLFAEWSELKPEEDGPYRWDVLNRVVEKKVGDLDKVLYLQVNASWPDWIFEHVAQAKFTERDEHPPQFWDPVYIDLYKTFIRDLADHIAQTAYKDKIILVRAQYNAFNPERIDPRGHTSYREYTPTPSGHRHNVDFTASIGNDYARQITRAYVDAFSPLGILAVQKPFGSWWEEDHLADEWADIGAGFFMTNGSPNPPNRHKIYELVKQKQVTRAFHEPHTDLSQKAGPKQVVYWSTLAALHQGMEFICFKGSDATNPDYEDIFDFANKYAGWYREPERSPGAWIAFRGVHASRWWRKLGNYEHLIKQIEPENHVGLFAYGPDDYQHQTLNPWDEPTTYLGPKFQKEGIWAIQTHGQPIYLDLDDAFAASLTDEIVIRVSYFDKGSGKFRLMFSNRAGELQTYSFQKGNTQLWKEVMAAVSSYEFANSLEKNADVLLDNDGDDDDVFHMVEIIRSE